MPIYMDFHDLPEINIEDSKKAHLNDLSVQEKYNVKYLQYWINELEGKAYCLIEAPSKEACEATHREANGMTACNLVEVKGGMYDLFLGDNQKLDHGLVRHFNGEVDNGYRFILSLELENSLHLSHQIGKKHPHYDQLKLECIALVEKYHGRDLIQTDQEEILGIFRTAEAALKCSLELRSLILKRIGTRMFKSYRFKMGLCVGQPVTAQLGFFEEAMNFALILSNISKDSQITTSRFFFKLSGLQEDSSEKNGIRIIDGPDGEFLIALHGIIQKNLEEEQLNVDFLGRELGVSRAQLYRKTKLLTGLSPNHYIRDQRLSKALNLLSERILNISEIAQKAGFNNPSYFSKCFQKRYGVSPSKIK